MSWQKVLFKEVQYFVMDGGLGVCEELADVREFAEKVLGVNLMGGYGNLF